MGVSFLIPEQTLFPEDTTDEFGNLRNGMVSFLIPEQTLFPDETLLPEETPEVQLGMLAGDLQPDANPWPCLDDSTLASTSMSPSTSTSTSTLTSSSTSS